MIKETQYSFTTETQFYSSLGKKAFLVCNTSKHLVNLLITKKNDQIILSVTFLRPRQERFKCHKVTNLFQGQKHNDVPRTKSTEIGQKSLVKSSSTLRTKFTPCNSYLSIYLSIYKHKTRGHVWSCSIRIATLVAIRGHATKF